MELQTALDGLKEQHGMEMKAKAVEHETALTVLRDLMSQLERDHVEEGNYSLSFFCTITRTSFILFRSPNQYEFYCSDICDLCSQSMQACER